MKIYAVYDLMIGYFMTPFIAPDDRQVLASLSADISREDNKNAVAYAPHHFQVWKLGVISDDGEINPGKELICDLGSLIRARRETTEQRHYEATHPFAVRPEGLSGIGGDAGTNSNSVPKGTQIKHTADTVTHPRTSGGN